MAETVRVEDLQLYDYLLEERHMTEFATRIISIKTDGDQGRIFLTLVTHYGQAIHTVDYPLGTMVERCPAFRPAIDGSAHICPTCGQIIKE